MIKILSSAQKNDLGRRELLAYEKKLRTEVNRRASRFEEDDKFFKEKSFAHNSFIGKLPKTSEKVASVRYAKLNNDDLRQALVNLESMIKSPQSTKKGRKAKADKSWETFKGNIIHEGWSRTKYNRFIKAMNNPAIRNGMIGMVEDYMLSEDIATAFRTGFNFDDMANAIIELGESNLLNFGSRDITGEMVLRVMNGEDANEVLESVTRRTEPESNNE